MVTEQFGIANIAAQYSGGLNNGDLGQPLPGMQGLTGDEFLPK
jgi:hypothetical protein